MAEAGLRYGFDSDSDSDDDVLEPTVENVMLVFGLPRDEAERWVASSKGEKLGCTHVVEPDAN